MRPYKQDKNLHVVSLVRSVLQTLSCPKATCTCGHTQTRWSSTHSTPEVTPQDKSFTVPLTGRWDNQLTSQPSSVSCFLGVSNRRAPRLTGTGRSFDGVGG